MPKRILIEAVYPEETRVAILENNKLIDFDYESTHKTQLKGNIYLAKVTRVEPSLQAAFVDYGGNRHGFLPFSEIHPDYYQIPVADRKRLLEAYNIQSNDTQTSPIINEFSPMEESSTEGRQDLIPLAKLPVPEDDASQDLSDQDFAFVPQDNITGSTEDRQSNTISALDELHLPGDPYESLKDSTALSPNDELLGDDFIEEISPIGSVDEQEGHDVEEDDEEDEEVAEQRSRHAIYNHYKIQEVIKRNQVILVQVLKEERGNKGAALTTYMSLAGRYCVLMPNTSRSGGVSRKISNPEDRKRLKEVVEMLTLPAGASVIVRTAGADKSKADIRRDYDYLLRLWSHIRDLTLSSSAPSFIYAEEDLIKRTIRDLYDNKVDEVVVDGEDAYQNAKRVMKMLLPSHAGRVKLYKDDMPLFLRYKVEEQLAGLYSQVAKLESGGYLVINPTEALTSIDVNSGRATSERNIEETAVKTNVEAAREVARQIRLRDIAGLVVIDFIDMLENRNRRSVERALKDALNSDRAKIQIGRIGPFGLLEMSRQRLHPSFLEANTVQCRHCEGRGSIRAIPATALSILRALEYDAIRNRGYTLEVFSSQPVITYLINNKRSDLATLESKYRISVQLFIDGEIGEDSFSLDVSKPISTKAATAPASHGAQIEYAPETDFIDESESFEEAKPKVRPSRRNRNWRKRGGQSSIASQDASYNEPVEKDAEEISSPAASSDDDISSSSRRRRSRPRRGRRTPSSPRQAHEAHQEHPAPSAPKSKEPAPSEEKKKPARRKNPLKSLVDKIVNPF